MEQSPHPMALINYGDIPDLTNVKKVLVIKLRHLGDVLLTTPLFSILKRALPRAEISAYVYREAVPILEGHPSLDHCFEYDREETGGRFWKECSLFYAIRKQKFDLVINGTEGDRGIITALVSGAAIRVGFQPKGKWQKRALTHIAKSCPTPRHTVERNIDVLRRIGIFPLAEEKELVFFIPQIARETVGRLIGKTPFLLIHPTSRWRFKCWPLAKMRQLIEQLLLRGRKVVISAGPDPQEREFAAEIARGLKVLDLGGSLSLKELGALIDAAELSLCVDSFPFHLANALKRPVIALFGPTSEITWGPWRNPNAQVITQPFSCRPCYLDGCGGSKRSNCLDSLPLETVMEAIDLYYNRKSSPK